MPLKELIKTQIYLSFEYNNNNISAVTLHAGQILFGTISLFLAFKK